MRVSALLLLTLVAALTGCASPDHPAAAYAAGHFGQDGVWVPGH